MQITDFLFSQVARDSGDSAQGIATAQTADAAPGPDFALVVANGGQSGQLANDDAALPDEFNVVIASDATPGRTMGRIETFIVESPVEHAPATLGDGQARGQTSVDRTADESKPAQRGLSRPEMQIADIQHSSGRPWPSVDAVPRNRADGAASTAVATSVLQQNLAASPTEQIEGADDVPFGRDPAVRASTTSVRPWESIERSSRRPSRVDLSEKPAKLTATKGQSQFVADHDASVQRPDARTVGAARENPVSDISTSEPVKAGGRVAARGDEWIHKEVERPVADPKNPSSPPENADEMVKRRADRPVADLRDRVLERNDTLRPEGSAPSPQKHDRPAVSATQQGSGITGGPDTWPGTVEVTVTKFPDARRPPVANPPQGTRAFEAIEATEPNWKPAQNAAAGSHPFSDGEGDRAPQQAVAPKESVALRTQFDGSPDSSTSAPQAKLPEDGRDKGVVTTKPPEPGASRTAIPVEADVVGVFQEAAEEPSAWVSPEHAGPEVRRQESAAPKADLARPIATQIGDAVRQSQSGRIDIRLSPEELGHVRLTMSQTEAGLVVTIAAERPETADLMRRHVDILAQELKAQGHQSLSFEFSQNGAQREFSERWHGESDPGPADMEVEDARLRPPTGQRLALAAGSRLDIRI